MAYEIYKKLLTKDEYFDNWDNDNYNNLNNELRDQIYEKYMVKTKVFQRDRFKCTNAECRGEPSRLTMHHVKWQKNGGEDKTRNCVTLCHACHKGFHRGKNTISFAEESTVPSHLRGHTFKVDTQSEIDWKKVKKDMKNLRKNVRDRHGIRLSYKQIYFLLQWLDTVVDLDDSHD